MSKHSIRIGSALEVERSRAAPRAPRRGAAASARRRTSRDASASSAFSLRELLQPPLLAALRRAHLDARAAQLGEERLPAPRCPRGRAARSPAAAPTAPSRSTRGRTPRAPRRGPAPADVLEVERVAVDQPAVAQREDLHGGAVAARPRAPITSIVPIARRSAACRSARLLDREQPVAVPRRVLEALLRGGRRASAARARARSGGSSPERNSITPSISAR